MGIKQELTLKEFAGQKCDVVILQRDDGSVFVRFDSRPGYGTPYLEDDEIIELLNKIMDIKE